MDTLKIFALERKYCSNCLNKCFDRSMEVKLPALLGNYDKQKD